MHKGFSVPSDYSSMQIRRRIFLYLSWLILVIAIIFIQGSMLLSFTNIDQEQLHHPLKIYYFYVLPEIAYQRININPPATKAIITIQPGDVSIRCGYNFRVYTCVSGKSLEITTTPDNPIREFWVQNYFSSHARIAIAIYEVCENLG